MTAMAVASAESESVDFALHDGQIAVWRAPHRFKVVVAGRRWGKTLLARVWLLAQALTGGEGRYWYVAPTRDDAKDVMWADLKASCHPDWLADDPSETELSLYLTNGAEIRLMSAEKGEKLRGRALKALVMDEYAIMPPGLFDEVLSPALADFESPVLWIGTPKSFNHFYALFERGQDPAWSRWASWQFRSCDNPTPHIQREYREARDMLDERTYRQEWDASFEAMAGRAYYAFSRADNVRPVELDPHAPVAVAFDFNLDPATVVIGQAQAHQPRVWRCVQLTHRGGEATKAVALAARDLLKGHVGQIRIYGDATGRAAKTTGPSDHAVIRSVFPDAVWCIGRQNPHQRDRVAAVNSVCLTDAGERRLLVDPSCSPVIADLEQVIYADNGEIDKTSNRQLTHASDAVGYWIEREWPVTYRGPQAAVVSAAKVRPPRYTHKLTAHHRSSKRRELEAYISTLE